MPSEAVKAVGLIVTLLGLVLLVYAFAVGWSQGYMGDCIKYNETTQECEAYGWGTTSYSAVLGWFLVIIGPALAFGETPAKIAEKAGK